MSFHEACLDRGNIHSTQKEEEEGARWVLSGRDDVIFEARWVKDVGDED